MTGIYKIESFDGQIYLGQSRDILKRFVYHRSGTSSNKPLKKSIDEYGEKYHVFSVCHELPIDVEQSVLNDYERLYIHLYRQAGIKTFNIHPGGNYTGRRNVGRRATEIARKNLSASLKGRVFGEDTKAKMKKSQSNRSSKTIGKMVESLKVYYSKNNGWRYIKRDFSKDLIHDYLNIPINRREIAKKYNISLTTLKRVLKENNVAPRPKQIVSSLHSAYKQQFWDKKKST